MKANELIKKLIDSELKELHTALPAKIESYDPEKLRAKVTLLAKKELEDENVTIPPILEVPVMVYGSNSIMIRPGYEKGDKVQVLFNERALDKILITGEPEEVEFKRKHSLDDAVVIGSLKVEQQADLPSENSEDFLIYNNETSEKVVVKKSGGITVTSSDIKLGSDSASEAAALGTSLKSWLDGHIHPGDSGGTTGPPNSPSPDPSSKVFLE